YPFPPQSSPSTARTMAMLAPTDLGILKPGRIASHAHLMQVLQGVSPEIHHLVDVNSVDLTDDSGQRQDEQVSGKTRVDTTRIKRRATVMARGIDPVDVRLTVLGPIPPRPARRDDILAAAQQAAHLV